MISAQLTLHETVKESLCQLGLKSVESDFEGLELGKPVFLEGKTLGEVGIAFILLEALSSKIENRNQRTFDSLSGFGIPICSWDEKEQRNCLILKLSDSKIAIKLDVSDPKNLKK